MNKFTKTAAIALAASSMVAAAPASAAIFEYVLGRDGNHVLVIDTEKQTGTVTGAKLNVEFEGPELANFQGGANPSFAIELTNMTGTRLINGTEYTPTTQNGDRFHPWVLKTNPDGRINVWSWWGDPVVSGDFVRTITGYRVVDVPAPGVIGLLALALGALGFGRRRRKQKLAAA